MTRYWKYQRDFTPDERKGIGHTFGKLVDSLPEVPLAGPKGEGAPEFQQDILKFNGTLPRAVEPFVLCRTRSAWLAGHDLSVQRPWRGFCKTENQPYHLAVKTMLLLVRQTAPGALTIELDQDVTGEDWAPARKLYGQLTAQ